MMLSLLALTMVAALPDPLQIVKAADDDVQKILQGSDATTAKLAETADKYIDFGELAKRALGTEWANLKKPQQDDFCATMKGLLRASYAQKAIGDGRASAKIAYGSEMLNCNEATVLSTVTVKKDDFPVVYKLCRANEKAGWKIYDVITDEVSLVQTYNDQFRRTISKKGIDGLLKALKARRVQLEAPVAPADVPGK